MRAVSRLLPADWDLFVNTLSREVLGWRSQGAGRLTEIFRQGTLSPKRLAVAFRELAESDVSESLQDVHVPTVVCHRRDCPVPSLDAAKRLATGSPGAELVVFPGKSPLVFTENPEIVQRVVLAATNRTGDDDDESPLQILVDEHLSAGGLTDRKIEILELAAIGTPNRGIAAELGISASTVKNYLTSVYAKLGVHNRTSAVARAREENLIA